MPTRKELIDQVRADQRARSARTRADSPKSAIVGIGDRDPKTGLFAVQTGDGVDGLGEKQFNSSLPKGSQVLGVPSTGGWLLDERDVQPIKPTAKPSPMGNIKVLFSTIEGDERVFYVGGDRATPKRIYAIRANRIIGAALISNAGEGNQFLVSLNHVASNGLDSQKIIISSGKEWQVMTGDIYPTGHGFWTQALGTTSIGTPLVSVAFDLVSRSQFLGDVREITGGRVVADGIDKDYPRISNGSSNNAIAPKIDRLTKSFLYQDNDGGRIGPNTYIRSQIIYNIEARRALILGKKAASAIYESIDSKYDEVNYLGVVNEQPAPPPVITRLFIRDAILVNCVTTKEIKLGGELPKNASDPAIVEFRVSDNLIKSKYHRVQLDSSTFGKPTKPDVDIHSLSANSTKKTIKARMYGIPKPSSGMPTDAAGLAALTSQLRQGQPVTIGNVTIYNASYHP